MARDLPYYRLWVKDFDTNENVRLLNLPEAGLFLFALNHAWINDGLPESEDDVARALKISASDFRKYWPRVRRCFSPDGNGRLRNHRQEEEREMAAAKSKQASEAVAERERKRIGRSIGRSSDDDLRAYGSDNVSSSDLLFPVEEKKPEPQFEDFWKVWWNSKAKAETEKHWPIAARKYGAQFLVDACLADRKRFEGTDDWSWRIKLHPTTWLRGRRWEDLPAPTVRAAKNGNGRLLEARPTPVAATDSEQREALQWIAEFDPDPAAREDAKRRLHG